MIIFRKTSTFDILVVFFYAATLATPISAQSFTTIINVPPDIAPSSVGSNTQLNLFDSGSLGNNFNAGSSLGLSRNIEININGGTVGSGFEAFRGSIVNISGGSVGVFFLANSGSTINMTGGVMERDLIAWNGGNVNISGGIVGESAAISNSVVNIGGGRIGQLFAGKDSTVNISGGVFGDFFRSIAGSSIDLRGGEFRLDDVPVSGLDSLGNTVGINLPQGSVLTGTLADGSVIILEYLEGTAPPQHDVLDDGTLTLTSAVVPVKTQSVINAPADAVPRGLRDGQTLNLGQGVDLGDNFAAVGANMNINGGVVGTNLEIVDTVLNLTEGSVGEGIDIIRGSEVNINGGTLGENAYLQYGGTISIESGSIGRGLRAYHGSTVNISGGEVGSGLNALYGSTVNFTGASFILDGIDLTPGLTPNEIVTITDRDVILEGILADGTPFSFNLDPVEHPYSVQDHFATSATLTISLVPEPGTLGLIGMGSLYALRRRRMS